MNCLKKVSACTLSVLTLAFGFASAPDSARADASPYVGDIMIVGFGFCPRGWLRAEGQILTINQNTALFSLLGTQFGGDGHTTFALPDLRGRLIVGRGAGAGLTYHFAGQKGGVQETIMTEDTLATHNHMVNANNLDGNKAGPANKLLAAAPTGGAGNETIYSDQPANRQMSANMIGQTGGGVAINTQDPFLALYHCIATEGEYPTRG